MAEPTRRVRWRLSSPWSGWPPAPRPAASRPAAPASAPAAGAAAPAARGTLRFAVRPGQQLLLPDLHRRARGYYRELGLELDTKEVNPPTATQALLANQFDVAHAASPGIAAALKGAPLKLIYLVAEPSPYWIIAKKDLQAWSDLKGKTIGVSSTTGTQVLDVSRVLAQHGVNAQADGINYVVPGGRGNEHKVDGLRAGSIDAGVFAGVGAVVALADGQSLLGDMHGIKTYDYTLWASNQALENKRDLVAAFVLGTLKGVRVYRHDPTRAVEHVTAAARGQSARGPSSFTSSARPGSPTTACRPTPGSARPSATSRRPPASRWS